jgi:hypothetical protein
MVAAPAAEPQTLDHTAVADDLDSQPAHVVAAAAAEAAPAAAAVAVVEEPVAAPARVINLTGVWEKDLEVGTHKKRVEGGGRGERAEGWE